MKPNFRLMPPLEGRNRQQRYAAYAERALEALDSFIAAQDLLPKGATA